MNLALFDLDNTILNGDSDHGWGMYLADVGAVDPHSQQQKQDHFYQQYVDGELDIYEFCEYQFEVLKNTSMATLLQWRSDFIEQKITPMVESGRQYLMEHHREQGDRLVIITATSDFVTEPIADLLNADALIATRAERSDGAFTGKVAGTASFQQGKIERLREWLEQSGEHYEKTYSYSDSFNDLPLLEFADVATAVNPDERLRQHARGVGWKIID